MINTILWDIDGTLLDFYESQKAALRACFLHFDLGECTDEMVSRYAVVNAKRWEQLELGELTKSQVLVGRFQEFFSNEGIVFQNADDFNAEYQERLGDTICYIDDSYEIMRHLRGQVRQYAVTNGTRISQERKLRRSGLGEMFDDVFISDDIGCEKPGYAFFDYVFHHIGPTEKNDILIVGDSLTSDMKGGNNAGIRCCWYNPQGLPNTWGVRVDYNIHDLHEVEKIIFT